MQFDIIYYCEKEKGKCELKLNLMDMKVNRLEVAYTLWTRNEQFYSNEAQVFTKGMENVQLGH